MPAVILCTVGLTLGVVTVTVDGAFLMGVAAIVSSVSGLLVALGDRRRSRRRVVRR